VAALSPLRLACVVLLAVTVTVAPAAADPVTGVLPAGGTIALGDAEVTVPGGGPVTLADLAAGPAPAGYEVAARAIGVAAPDATPADPLRLVFGVEPAEVPGGADAATLVVFRDGSPVPGCEGGVVAQPDPCVAERSQAANSIRLVVLTSRPGTFTFGRVAPPPQLPLIVPADFAARLLGGPARALRGMSLEPIAGAYVRSRTVRFEPGATSAPVMAIACAAQCDIVATMQLRIGRRVMPSVLRRSRLDGRGAGLMQLSLTERVRRSLARRGRGRLRVAVAVTGPDGRRIKDVVMLTVRSARRA
jgi:hypothetical protein